jgi:hypothetical protein
MPCRGRRALAGILLIPLGLPATACSTGAVGIPECRDIEKARCKAARSCDLGIDSRDDAEVCDRFARDNCLHGLAVSDTPKSSEVAACVRAIERAGACAAGSGADTLASECQLGSSVTSPSATACGVVQDPEEADACSFLIETEPEDDEEDPPSEPDAGEPDAG